MICVISEAVLVLSASLAGGSVLKLQYWWDREGTGIFSLQGTM